MGSHPIRIAACGVCKQVKRLYTTTTCSACHKAAIRRARQAAKVPQVYWCATCKQKKVERAGARCAVCAPNRDTARENDLVWAAWAGKDLQ